MLKLQKINKQINKGQWIFSKERNTKYVNRMEKVQIPYGGVVGTMKNNYNK